VTLSIHAEPSGDDTVLISVSGVVEHHNAQQVPGAVHAAIVRWSPRAVFIDVAAVTLIDSAGIAALLASGKAAAAASTTLAVINPGDLIYRQLQVSQVADLLCPHLAAAVDDRRVGTAG
jgi:anti-anti-sigma factor